MLCQTKTAEFSLPCSARFAHAPKIPVEGARSNFEGKSGYGVRRRARGVIAFRPYIFSVAPGQHSPSRCAVPSRLLLRPLFSFAFLSSSSSLLRINGRNVAVEPRTFACILIARVTALFQGEPFARERRDDNAPYDNREAETGVTRPRGVVFPRIHRGSLIERESKCSPLGQRDPPKLKQRNFANFLPTLFRRRVLFVNKIRCFIALVLFE